MKKASVKLSRYGPPFIWSQDKVKSVYRNEFDAEVKEGLQLIVKVKDDSYSCCQ